MDKKKLLIGGGLAAAMLLLLTGTSRAGEEPNPNPNPNPNPKPNKGPHPPPWPNLPTATVRVEGTNPATGKPYRGMIVRTGPSRASAALAAEPEVFNGAKIAILGEQREADGRVWVRAYTPNGYEGWISSVDPQGVRNVWYDNMRDEDQRPELPVGTTPRPIGDAVDTIQGEPHGWYPYCEPARAAAPPRPVQAGRYPFR